MPNDPPRRQQEPPALKRRFRGFDPDAVRRLLDRRASEREDLEQRLAQLEAQHAHQRAELEELRDREHLISGAITTAQRAADEIRADADQAAAERLAAVEAEAQRRLDRAEQQLAELTDLGESLAVDLAEQAERMSERLRDARRGFGLEAAQTPAPSEPPPLPMPAPATPLAEPAEPVVAASSAPVEVSVEPVADTEAVAASEHVAVPLDDLPAEGQRTIRVRLSPVGSPAEVAAAERRVHALDGVRTVRLDDFAGGSAALLVGIDIEHLDIAPLLEAGADLVSADRETIELYVPDGWT